MGRELNIVSYNLRKHHASGELRDLSRLYDVDVMCLQECDTSDIPERIDHLVLADSTKTNRLGLAVYYRDDRFDLEATRVFALRKSMHDRVMAPAHERLLAARLFDKEIDKEILVGSFHAAPLTASNSLRRKQIAAAHSALRVMGPGLPTVMVGDYNYPWFRANLSERMEESGYLLSFSDKPTYARYKYFKGHFDFVTSAHTRIDSIDTLPQGESDHLPILVKAGVED
ncbi:endonuclease/exonuclease/phosphatase family protein [Herbiconiux daphne]|uniref:Endonuclease/exonuclease/phosphatase family protein n=1 Tax=Herbiconiux daphne TaxID=2970914 RepID=A0ABT2H7C6_9MICO|nr:endonuclease/exonuclease/phosphatase family protein [Herbiconiux daphne]MCS5735827.1 endonuclease/exonuclease/phosphatase family protein [Herbiconiux daphne]